MDDKYKHPVDEKKVRFRVNFLNSKNENRGWIIIITVVSFFLSMALSFTSSKILEDVNNIIALIVVLVIIIINIIFDIIGTAVTAANEAPFHAMASRKLYGARQAKKMVRNADKVSNFCNDVVGDICGVISGTASAYIVIRFSANASVFSTAIIGLVIPGLVAALTVGGKALGKTFAITNSNYIVYKVGVVLKFVFGRITFANTKRKKKQK